MCTTRLWYTVQTPKITS